MQCRSRCTHFTSCISLSGFSDWVLISVRWSRPHCSVVIHSAPTLFFRVSTERLHEHFCLSAFSSTAKTSFFQSQCESCHSCAFPLLKKTVQSQWYSAGKARVRGVAVPQLKSEPYKIPSNILCGRFGKHYHLLTDTVHVVYEPGMHLPCLGTILACR